MLQVAPNYYPSLMLFIPVQEHVPYAMTFTVTCSVTSNFTTFIALKVTEFMNFYYISYIRHIIKAITKIIIKKLKFTKTIVAMPEIG